MNVYRHHIPSPPSCGNCGQRIQEDSKYTTNSSGELFCNAHCVEGLERGRSMSLFLASVHTLSRHLNRDEHSAFIDLGKYWANFHVQLLQPQ